MAEDIWEKSKYKVKVSLIDDSKPYDGKVDLLLLKNGDQSKPLKSETDITVKPGKPIERNFDVPEVEPDEATYKLSLLVKYGASKEKTQELADATVWPKTVEIHVKNHEDSEKDFKDVKLVVKQGGSEVAKPVTDKDGKCKVELTRKQAYAVDVRSPYEIVRDDSVPAKLRVHELVAIRHIVCMFVKPDVTKDKPWKANDPTNNEANRKTACRLYVNLKSKNKDAAEGNGHIIEFEVCAKPKTDGKKGDRIFLTVSFSRDSDRNDPLPKLLDAPAVNDLDKDADAKVYTGYVKLDKDGGTAKFKVDTGLAGGDVCTVSIGSRKDATTDEQRSFVNWRKLWYELRFPTLLVPKLSWLDYPAALKTAFRAKLGKAFVEYEQRKYFTFPDAQATFAKGNGMIMKKRFFKEASDDEIYVVTNGWLNTKNRFSDDGEFRKRSVYVSLCERAFSSNVSTDTVEPEVTSDDFDFPEPNGDTVFPLSPKNGKPNPSVEAAFEWQAIVAADHTRATEWVELAGVGGGAGKVVVSALDRPGKSVTVAFAAKDGGGHETSLSATETSKIENFVADLLSSDPALRDSANKLRLNFSGPGGDGGPERISAARDAAKSKFDAVGKTLNYHPGLDRDGNARHGPMKVAWVTVKDYETLNIKLPKSGSTDHKKLLPGDYVGAAETDTECKVKVKFKYVHGGEINGNSGGGEQIMVLRAAATPGALSETICHELGHSMGMAVIPGLENDILPPGITTKHVDNGGTSYVNGDPPYPLTDGKRSIHKGGHCAFSVPATDRASDDFNDWSPTAGCIMWGSGGNAETRTAYCDECLKVLKGRRLEDIISSFGGRDADQG
ncbi:MAG: hypothetical protein IPM01_03080 [Burkholderiaceae bacterium]|nr:hypothetical protein [Burkholderiaceae bacterium]